MTGRLCCFGAGIGIGAAIGEEAGTGMGIGAGITLSAPALGRRWPREA